MRQALLVVAALAVLAVVARAPPTEAGERALVNLQVTDAGSSTSAVGQNQRVEIQCPDAGAWIAVDGRTTCNPGYPCILMAPGALLPTVAQQPEDGGRSRVTAACLSGVTACACSVWSLQGNEGL